MIKPITDPGVYFSIPDIDNKKWHWFFDMSLLETMIFCCNYIRIDAEHGYKPITILGLDNEIFLPITYHITAEVKNV